MNNTFSKRESWSISALLLVMGLMIGACREQPKLHKEKFGGVHEAAKSIKASIETGAQYQQVSASLDKLAAELSALKGTVSSANDLELLNAYETLLTVYEDGHTLWKYKLEFARFGIVPKDRIYMSQDVEPIAFKYNFPAESHLYKPTGQYWRSISDEAIPIVWKNADFQWKVIEGLRNYN